MESKRILIFACGPVLGIVVESLLASEPGLVVFRLTDEEDLLKSVARYQPSILVIDETAILYDNTLLSSLLTQYPEMQVVGVSGDDNWLHLYWTRDVLIQRAKDFTELFQHS